MSNLLRLRDFVVAVTQAIEANQTEAEQIGAARVLLADLVAQDDWIPEDYTRPLPEYYAQYLLHADPLGRFSLVSFVWGPGQRTPVHDHRVWGLVGVLRGVEISTSYRLLRDGSLEAHAQERLEAGSVSTVSPSVGDIHSVANAYDDRVSISVHLYGGNIGAIRRAVYEPATGVQKLFISGYSNSSVPNLWGQLEAA
jgi:3-mercaptopropionate dioxygenase